jgi:hypothetical protein
MHFHPKEYQTSGTSYLNGMQDICPTPQVIKGHAGGMTYGRLIPSYFIQVINLFKSYYRTNKHSTP